MLDLQDDLAGVVMWLAENWSADLPLAVPCTAPTTTTTCRGLSPGRCAAADAGAAMRAAGSGGRALGSAGAHRPPSPTRHGLPLRGARCAAFGRVEVKVYTLPLRPGTPS